MIVLGESNFWFCFRFSSIDSGGSRIFPRGGANSQSGCVYLLFLPKTCFENERIWTPRGGRAQSLVLPPLDPPMIDHNAKNWMKRRKRNQKLPSPSTIFDCTFKSYRQQLKNFVNIRRDLQVSGGSIIYQFLGGG